MEGPDYEAMEAPALRRELHAVRDELDSTDAIIARVRREADREQRVRVRVAGAAFGLAVASLVGGLVLLWELRSAARELWDAE